jgi:hypothetical protein
MVWWTIMGMSEESAQDGMKGLVGERELVVGA